jgi:hypothetical protein
MYRSRDLGAKNKGGQNWASVSSSLDARLREKNKRDKVLGRVGAKVSFQVTVI